MAGYRDDGGDPLYAEKTPVRAFWGRSRRNVWIAAAAFLW